MCDYCDQPTYMCDLEQPIYMYVLDKPTYKWLWPAHLHLTMTMASSDYIVKCVAKNYFIYFFFKTLKLLIELQQFWHIGVHDAQPKHS